MVSEAVAGAVEAAAAIEPVENAINPVTSRKIVRTAAAHRPVVINVVSTVIFPGTAPKLVAVVVVVAAVDLTATIAVVVGADRKNIKLENAPNRNGVLTATKPATPPKNALNHVRYAFF